MRAAAGRGGCGEVNLLRNERVVWSVYLQRRTHSTRADALCGEVNLLRNERVVWSVYLQRRTHSTRADALYHLW